MCVYHLKLGAVIGILGAATIGKGAGDVASPADTPVIVLKHTDPVRVVFLEHTGPYWTVGPLFKRVREAMADHDETGPLFVRYHSNPTIAPAASLSAEVGFESRGDWDPEPPLKIAQRDGEQVVSLVVEGSYGTTAKSYSVMHDWVASRGFEAIGPMIEWYPSPQKGDSRAAYRTEIQIPVRRALAAVGTTAEPKAPHAIAPISDESPAQSKRNESDLAESTEPLYPIMDLVDASRFDRVAEQLIPTENSMPAGMRVWFGQVVFRVSALARGLEQTYPAGSPQATALAEAIVRRYRQASSAWKIDPLAHAVVRVDHRSDPQSQLKRLIVRDLDNLLGQVALKSVDAHTAMGRLGEILGRVQEILHGSQP